MYINSSLKFHYFFTIFTIQVVLICDNSAVHSQNKRGFARYFAVSSLTLSIWLKVLTRQRPTVHAGRKFEMFAR